MKSNIVVILFSLVGVLFAGLGAPLALGRIAPNGWYGYRVPKTLANADIWYAVNRATGRDLILAGLALVIFSILLHAVFPRLGALEGLVDILALFLFAGAAIIHSTWILSGL